MHVKFNGEAEWHALREAHIGGSEVASLFLLWQTPDGNEVVRHLYEESGPDDICLGGLSSFKSGFRLWAEKSGKIPPDDLSDVGRIQAGQYLEPAIAEWAKRRFPSFPLLKSRVYHQHPTIRGFGASLDYFIRKGMEPVDIKNVDGFIFRQKWEIDDTNAIVDFPLHIVLQIQHQIACIDDPKRGLKAERGHVLACVGGNELYLGSMPRHQPTIDKIEIAIQAFWYAVDNGLAPPVGDLPAVKEVFAVGLDKDAEGAILDFGGKPEIDRLLSRAMRWGKHAKFVEVQLELIKGRIGMLIGDHYGMRTDGFKVSWPTIQREEKVVSYVSPASTYRGGMRVSPISAPKPKKKAANA